MKMGVEMWKQRLRQLKTEVYAVYLAYQDPRTPWYARLWAAGVVGYAFSPIDLVPDFIPILGYLDDLLIVPLGIALALKMIPAEVMTECRAQAHTALTAGLPVSRRAAVIIIVVWVLLAALGVGLVLRWLR
jgi:uncharacterized membrane protein YkvA (DUF1232 family)